jgi:hypothetical protein
MSERVLRVDEWNNRGEWNMEVGVRSLNMIISMYSLCLVTACKLPFSIHGPKIYELQDRNVFKISEIYYFVGMYAT